MARGRVKVDLDIDSALARIALDAIPLVQEATEFLRDEIKSRIPIADIPSEPGGPPNSTGPYRDSWKVGRVRRRGMFVRGSTFSSPEDVDIKQAAVLEYGSVEIGVAPRPHIRPAEDERERHMEAVVRQANRKNALEAARRRGRGVK